MDSKGFISTSLIISIIILASAIVLLMIVKRENNSIFADNISERIKTKLSDAKTPNCSWGVSPYMLLESSSATSYIILTCFHIDGIRNNLINELDDSTISSFISLHKDTREEVSDSSELRLHVLKVSAIHNGYTVLFEIKSDVAGKYYLRLFEDTISTNDEFWNHELTSADLIKNTKYITVEEGGL